MLLKKSLLLDYMHCKVMKMAMFAFFHLCKSKYLEEQSTEKDTYDVCMDSFSDSLMPGVVQ